MPPFIEPAFNSTKILNNWHIPSINSYVMKQNSIIVLADKQSYQSTHHFWQTSEKNKKKGEKRHL